MSQDYKVGDNLEVAAHRDPRNSNQMYPINNGDPIPPDYFWIKCKVKHVSATSITVEYNTDKGYAGQWQIFGHETHRLLRTPGAEKILEEKLKLSPEQRTKAKVMTNVLVSLQKFHGSYLFGGAVRDHLAGDTPRDFDIWFTSEHDAIAFQHHLSDMYGGTWSAGDPVDWQESDHASDGDTGYTRKNVIRKALTFDGVKIGFDFVTPRPGHRKDKSPFNGHLDLDVNGLTMTSKHNFVDARAPIPIYARAPVLAGTLQKDIEERARKRQFLPLKKEGAFTLARQAKIDKLKNILGWTSVSQSLTKEQQTVSFFADMPRGTKLIAQCRASTERLAEEIHFVRVEGDLIRVTSPDKFYQYVLPPTAIIGLLVDPTTKPTTNSEETVPKESTETLAKPTKLDMFKSDLGKGTYRAGARQVPKLAQAGLIAFLEARKVNKQWIKSIKEMMKTEAGREMIAFGMSWLVRSIPMLSEDPRAQKLAEEWSVGAIAFAEDTVVNEFMIYMGPAIQEIMKLPFPGGEQAKVRIPTEEIKKEVAPPVEDDGEELATNARTKVA